MRPNVRRASSVWDRDVSGKVAWCSSRRLSQFSAPGLETDSRAKVGAPQANGVLKKNLGGGVDLLLRFARASRANLVLHAWRHGIGGIGPTARVGFVAGEFWWLPSFAGGVCQGRLEFVSCLDGHLPSLSLTYVEGRRLLFFNSCVFLGCQSDLGSAGALCMYSMNI